MAANKFATILQRNTNRMSVIMVYTALEWALIFLLLLGALLSYLASKFAAFFGLEPPCVLCSRLDRAIEPGKLYTDLCRPHAAEVSRLSFCARHRRLAGAADMCEGCSSSRPAEPSWMKRSEAGEKDLRCSCCGVVLESDFFSPYLELKPSWCDSEKTQMGNSAENGIDQILSPHPDARVDTCLEVEIERDGEEEAHGEGEVLGHSLERNQEVHAVEDASLEAVIWRLEKMHDERRLISLELIDSMILSENSVASSSFEREYSTALVTSPDSISEGSSRILELVYSIVNEESSFVPPVEEPKCDLDYDQCLQPEEIPAISQDVVEVEVEEASVLADDSHETQASEDDNKPIDGDANCEVSIGSEICDQEQIDQSLCHETIPALLGIEVQCVENYSEMSVEVQVIETRPAETIIQSVDHISLCTDVNEVEEERMPETPTSIDGIHALHRRFFFERREPGTESFDGSVASEAEGSEILTMDGLKSALRAERKALTALYAELEEERSASAVAANQTMAMITRLQEEKAAMQMEALQYQRMMDEQSEYDQEALQLLNELMMKREKEKHDLEKELEIYRKKILRYDAKERRKIARSKVSGRSEISSTSSSGAEDSDGLSFDFHDGNECFDTINETNQNTPANSILCSGAAPEAAKHLSTLDESLIDFEEERLSIVEQLKVLEGKLFTLDTEEPSDNLEPMEHFPEENGHGFNGDYEASCNYENGIMNCSSDSNGELHHEKKFMDRRGKRLLPLFESVIMENEDELQTGQGEMDTSPESVSRRMMDHEKLAIAEEVDLVYERLNALEADREFLKHCISSLKKGDKGMDLLQEILQHLRDLRDVEHRERNVGDELASLSH